MTLPRLALPPSPAVLALLALAFVAPGLAGHAPWKAFDAVAIEVAHEMQRTGDWLVPRIAGEPWLEDPPLYHWFALAFARAFAWALPFHDAARLASGACMLAAAGFIYAAGGAAAALALLGSVGLIVHAHEAVPDLLTLAASCSALFFLSRKEFPLQSGLGFGISLGVAALSAGLVVPLALLLAALVAHLACDELRTRRALPFLAAAIAVALAIAASWPLVLRQHAAPLFADWWSAASRTQGEFAANLRYFLGIAGWFAWPAWPLALWALWALRKSWRAPGTFVPAAAALLFLAGAALAGPPQDINLIPLLAPLALLAAQGVGALRRGAANALDWFGVTTFTFFTALVWLGYLAMMTGWPPRVAGNFARLAPGFAPQFQAAPFVFALALALAWLYLAFFTAPAPARGLARWAAGVALLWGSFAALWLPWADHIRSYGGVARQLRAALPPNADCVARESLGDPQRAALSYHAGLRTVATVSKCRYVLVQGGLREEREELGTGWVRIAEAARPGDGAERYRLYRRPR